MRMDWLNMYSHHSDLWFICVSKEVFKQRHECLHRHWQRHYRRKINILIPACHVFHPLHHVKTCNLPMSLSSRCQNFHHVHTLWFDKSSVQLFKCIQSKLWLMSYLKSLKKKGVWAELQPDTVEMFRPLCWPALMLPIFINSHWCTSIC